MRRIGFLRALLPDVVRTLPRDLGLIIAITLATAIVASMPILADSPLRVILALPFLLFCPGYALTAALFPETHTEETGASLLDDPGISSLERLALSVGLSIAILLDYILLGINVLPIETILHRTGLVIALGAIAAGGTVRAISHGRWNRFAVAGVILWVTLVTTSLFAII